MKLSQNSGDLQCCGVRMLANIFPDDSYLNVMRGSTVLCAAASIGQRIKYLKKFQKEQTDGCGTSKALIAVLTDQEIIDDLGLAKAMKKQGWKLVHRFKNPSGSTCNILVWTARKSLPMRGTRSPWDQL